MGAALRPLAALAVLVLAAVALGACGTQGIALSKSSPYYKGAELFLQRCSGCHTLATVGAEGSAVSIKDRVRTNGPNFDFRKEQYDQVLYAIRNGGFSGAIMPQNIVVGVQAQEVAAFLAKYAGLQAPKVPSIENTAIPGSTESASTGTTGAAATAASTTAAAGMATAASTTTVASATNDAGSAGPKAHSAKRR
jgi:mono/diheme cytochrome c family protein